jgi:transcriptional regulator with XRE-family HTH domain
MGTPAMRDEVMPESQPHLPTRTFGDLLRCYRVEAGLTQEELAERSGMSVRGISDLERGARHAPYRHTLQQLARALALTEAEQAALDATRHASMAVARVGMHRDTPGGQETPRQSGFPVPLTSFIGRARDIMEARRLMTTARLLTLVGTGGVGKTRLALEVARDAPAERSAFVDLTSVSDGSLVAATVAAALGIRERTDMPLMDVLALELSHGPALIVLDNCEHVVQSCA